MKKGIMKINEEIRPHKDTIIGTILGLMAILDIPALEYISDTAAELAEFRKEDEKNDK